MTNQLRINEFKGQDTDSAGFRQAFLICKIRGVTDVSEPTVRRRIG